MTVFPQPTSGVHRCYGAVVRRHLVAAGLTAVPVAVAASLAAAAAWRRPFGETVSADRSYLVLLGLCVVLQVVGVLAWGLVEHFVAHCRDAARARADWDGAWLIDEQGRWWMPVVTAQQTDLDTECDPFVSQR